MAGPGEKSIKEGFFDDKYLDDALGRHVGILPEKNGFLETVCLDNDLYFRNGQAFDTDIDGLMERGVSIVNLGADGKKGHVIATEIGGARQLCAKICAIMTLYRIDIKEFEASALKELQKDEKDPKGRFFEEFMRSRFD